MGRFGGVAAFCFFAIPWAGATLYAHAITLPPMVRQVQSRSWPTVPGTITASEISSREDASDDGPSYSFAVAYTYEVNGQRHEGRRARHGNMSGSGYRAAARLQDQFPVGATVPIHYDPEQPSNAVLLAGLQGSDLFFLLFLTPFDIVSVGLIAATVAHLRGRRETIPSVTREGKTYVALENVQPLVAALICAAATSIPVVLIVTFFASASPSMTTMVIAWGVMLAACVCVYLHQRRRGASGVVDLIIDPLGRRLSVPALLDRKTRTELPWDRIVAVTTTAHETRDSDGDPHWDWRLTLKLRGSRGTSDDEGATFLALSEWKSQSRAEAFADWLRVTLRQHGLRLEDASRADEAARAKGIARRV